MKFKVLTVLALLIIPLNVVNAQKVKLKKGDVLVDGNKTFQYEKKAMASEFSLYTLDKENEILFILRNSNETVGYGNDDFIQITFLNDNMKLESATLKGYSFKWFVKKLLEDKVLDIEGNINSKKIITFIRKYDENITNRTIRY